MHTIDKLVRILRYMVVQDVDGHLSIQLPKKNEAATEALGRLGDVDREILKMHSWEMQSIIEIAEIKKISKQAVSKRLQRSRDILAQNGLDREEEIWFGYYFLNGNQ
jgi:DNA-directed RNA polymerase specialized sigma24 family protein